MDARQQTQAVATEARRRVRDRRHVVEMRTLRELDEMLGSDGGEEFSLLAEWEELVKEHEKTAR